MLKLMGKKIFTSLCSKIFLCIKTKGELACEIFGAYCKDIKLKLRQT